MKNDDLQFVVGKYPAYKDSGVKWIGEIPVGWEVKRLACFGVFSKGGGFSKSDLSMNGDRAILYGDIYTKYDFQVFDAVRFIPPGVSKKSVEIKKGHLLFTGSGETIDDIGKCVVFNGYKKTFAGGDVILFKPIKYDSTYLSYTLNSDAVKKEKAKTAKGEIIVHTYASKLKNIYIPIPSVREQKAIADFLDEKCEKIDRAVAQKEKMVELLKERKQIVIQALVSGKWLIVNDGTGKSVIARPDGEGVYQVGGKAVVKDNGQLLIVNGELTPELTKLIIKTKDSGVEWIGEIPVHWEVKRCKYLFYEADERSLEGQEELLSVSHMTGVTPRSEKDVNMFLAENYAGSKLCIKGDLVYNIMWAWMGALGVSNQLGIVSPSYGVYRQKKKGCFNPTYLEEFLKSNKYIEHYNKVSTGLHSSRLRFYSHMFFNMKIGFPTKDEQEQIISYIETQSAKIDKAISLQQKQIEKLKEYKATLINSAVTGKIRVPGVEA